MRNIFTLALLLCFIVCTHLKRDFNLNISKSISTSFITALQSLSKKTYTNSGRMNVMINNIPNTSL